MLTFSREAADALFGIANLLAIVGGVLVVFGTAGIFWFGSVREHYADQRIAANESATANANKEAALSQERNTALNLELEKERTERLKLEQRVLPRRVSDEHKAIIKNFLAEAPKVPVSMHFVYGDGEAEYLAEMLAVVLHEGGLEITERKSFRPGYGKLSAGVTVAWDSEEDAPKQLAGHLLAAFIQLGLSVHKPWARSHEGNPPPGEVRVYIGRKPIPESIWES